MWMVRESCLLEPGGHLCLIGNQACKGARSGCVLPEVLESGLTLRAAQDPWVWVLRTTQNGERSPWDKTKAKNPQWLSRNTTSVPRLTRTRRWGLQLYSTWPSYLVLKITTYKVHSTVFNFWGTIFTCVLSQNGISIFNCLPLTP